MGKDVLQTLCLQTPAHRSVLYERTVALRDEVLRRPLGLIFSDEDLDAESDDLHCAATGRDGDLLGCLVLTRVDEQTVRMRQVAVRPDRQGGGIGAVLVRFSEQVARSSGYRRMVLHARETAVAFYLRLGYEIEGEEFTEVGIPHRFMARRL